MSWNLHITTTGYYLYHVCALDENCDLPLLKYCAAHWTTSWSGLTWHHRTLDPNGYEQCTPRWAGELGSHLVEVLTTEYKQLSYKIITRGIMSVHLCVRHLLPITSEPTDTFSWCFVWISYHQGPTNLSDFWLPN